MGNDDLTNRPMTCLNSLSNSIYLVNSLKSTENSVKTPTKKTKSNKYKKQSNMNTHTHTYQITICITNFLTAIT